MERSYRFVGFFFITILFIVIWGFFRTYFVLFPDFKGITNVQHFHGVMMLSWFAMLIAQPFLIQYKKLHLHRALGKVSYALVPILLFSIFAVARSGFFRNAPNIPHQQNIGALALNLPPIFGFASLFILAIINKRNARFHMRYMIATSLLLIGPGIGRAAIIYGGMTLPEGVEVALFATELTCIGLIIYDLVKHNPYKPYLVALCVFVAMHLCWEFQMAWWWQTFAGGIVEIFF